MTTPTAVDDRISAGTWTIDRVHSSATFAVEHAGLSLFRGAFKDLDAELVVDDESVLSGVVQVESIDVEDENIRPHLLSPEFFDAERHPVIRFESSELSFDGDEVRLVGELEMAGATQPIEVLGTLRGPTVLPGGGEKLALAFETTIDRTAFGINWQMELPDGSAALGNDVTLAVELELAKE